MSAFPMVMSLAGRGYQHHAVRMVGASGPGLWESACGESGKTMDSAPVVDCPDCQKALTEPSMLDLARRTRAGQPVTPEEWFEAARRAAGAVS